MEWYRKVNPVTVFFISWHLGKGEARSSSR
jgi:hypothetical protein